MPLPIWLIPVALKGAAIAAGAVGVGSAVHGASKMKNASDTMESAKKRHERNIEKFEQENENTSKDMDKLGKLELEILHSFSEFSDVFEKIKNRPVFENYSKEGIELPEYDGEKLKEISVGAGVLLGGLSGAGLGVASGFAAAGATTSAVMALGTASTGTAITALSGAAATNATLALLGGGATAIGGGGIAAGTAALGAATFGVGLLVGGIIFNVTGAKLSDKADEAWAQMKKAEAQIEQSCKYLCELRGTSNKYLKTLSAVNEVYQNHLNGLKSIVNMLGHKDWNTFSYEERKLTENTVLLVGLLYNMCKVELVLKAEKENEMNKVNTKGVETSIENANVVLADKFQMAGVSKKTDTEIEFMMPIEDVFAISGRGIVLTGTVAVGEIHVTDKVVLVKSSGVERKVTVSGMEMYRKLVDAATVGENVGILVRELSREDVQVGDMLVVY